MIHWLRLDSHPLAMVPEMSGVAVMKICSGGWQPHQIDGSVVIAVEGIAQRG